MTPQQLQAMKLALEALEADELDMVDDGSGNMVFRKEQAITALEEALAQPEQEPVAWADLNALSEQINSVNCGTVYRLPSEEENRQPLYSKEQL